MVKAKYSFIFMNTLMKEYMLLTPIDLMKWIRIDKKNNSLKTELKNLYKYYIEHVSSGRLYLVTPTL